MQGSPPEHTIPEPPKPEAAVPRGPVPPPSSVPLPDPDAPLRDSLRRHRAVATGLLVAMAAILLGTYAMPPGYWTDLLQAGAKAGLVGGIADWFAVTALFRHPLGLPIPHTAIIPKQKERLGASLGRFVANHVFTEAEVRRLLDRVDLAGVLRGVLSDPAATRPAARAVASSLPKLLARVEDGRALKLAMRLLPRLADGPAAAKVLARAIRSLVAGGRHHAVFDLVMTEVRRLLREKEASLREEVERRVRDQGGSVVGWVAGAFVARRMVNSLNEALDDATATDSNLRALFDGWLEKELFRLEHDPERALQLGRALRGALGHEVVAEWLADSWYRARWAVELDTARPESRIAALVAAALDNAGRVLAEDPTARGAVNGAVQRLLIGLLPQAQSRLSGFIAAVIGNWDTATVTEKIELRVGRDLQYVRVNGTLVGFLVGVALFAALHAIFGRVAV